MGVGLGVVEVLMVKRGHGFADGGLLVGWE